VSTTQPVRRTRRAPVSKPELPELDPLQHLLAAMTAAFAASQIAGPLLVSFLVERSGGFAGALLLAFGILVASAAALMVPLPPATR